MAPLRLTVFCPSPPFFGSMPSLHAHWPSHNRLTSKVFLVIIILVSLIIFPFEDGFLASSPVWLTSAGENARHRNTLGGEHVFLHRNGVRQKQKRLARPASVYSSRTSDAKTELHVHHRYRRSCCGTTTRMVDKFFLSFFLSFFIFFIGRCY